MSYKLGIILIFSIYWIVIYIVLDIFLEKNKQKLKLNIKYSSRYIKQYNFLKRFKHKLPSVSRFDKTKVKSREKKYLKLYNEELTKAFYIHTLPFIFVLPFLLLNIVFFIINLIILTIFNVPFILIIVYNKMRIERVLKK